MCKNVIFAALETIILCNLFLGFMVVLKSIGSLKQITKTQDLWLKTIQDKKTNEAHNGIFILTSPDIFQTWNFIES